MLFECKISTPCSGLMRIWAMCFGGKCVLLLEKELTIVTIVVHTELRYPPNHPAA